MHPCFDLKLKSMRQKISFKTHKETISLTPLKFNHFHSYNTICLFTISRNRTCLRLIKTKTIFVYILHIYIQTSTYNPFILE